MEIPAFHCGFIGPGQSAKDRTHGIGRRIRSTVTPDEEIVIRILRTLQGLQEPAVLVGAMVQNQVHDNANAPLLTFRNQGFHVFHGAEHGVDGTVIRDIIAVIHLGRCAYRAQPDGVNTQFLQIVQTADDTPQVTYTVTVRILKALGIQLIKHCLLPPAALALIQHIHNYPHFLLPHPIPQNPLAGKTYIS